MKYKFNNTSNVPITLPSKNGGKLIIDKNSSIVLDEYYEQYAPHILTVIKRNISSRPKVLIKANTVLSKSSSIKGLSASVSQNQPRNIDTQSKVNTEVCSKEENKEVSKEADKPSLKKIKKTRKKK
jgi:hypothetical protein